jgi:D-alanyl-D-alanine carboxypeptidase
MIRRSVLRLGLALVVALSSFSTALAPSIVGSAVQANTGAAPACRYTDVLTKYRSYTDWYRSLLDPTYRLSSVYVPPLLVPTSRAGIFGGGYIRSSVISDLAAMTAAARAAGAPIRVVSAYRSYASQVATFNYYVSHVGYAAALKVSARPGHSEHQLGTAIDFGSLYAPVPWVSDWVLSKAGAWMAANAWKYGFVMSYPKGQYANSCYNYEPWHYRYWGIARAKLIHDSGLVPRIWLWRTTDY